MNLKNFFPCKKISLLACLLSFFIFDITAQNCNGVSVIETFIQDDNSPNCSISTTFKVNGAISEVDFTLTLGDNSTISVPASSPNRITISGQGTYTEIIEIPCNIYITSVMLNAYKNNGDPTAFCTSNLVTDLDLAFLPVELSHFDSHLDRDNVTLKWTTETEKNNDYFAIERSKNGEDFYEIGHVNGHGTSIEKHQYSFVDPKPILGINYYRLKQIDFNGNYSFSHIEAVRIKMDSKEIEIVNTVATQELMIVLPETHKDFIPIVIFDMFGRPLLKKAITSDTREIALDISLFTAGNYFISFEINGEIYSKSWAKILM